MIPSISEDLIRMLDKEFPHLCPTLRQSEREIYFYAGKRALIDLLLARLNEAPPKNEGNWLEKT